MKPFERATNPTINWKTIWKMWHKKFPIMTKEMCKQQAEKTNRDIVWMNDLYQVNIAKCKSWGEGFPDFIHLSIKRLDKEPVRDWRHMQQIKNELVGVEYEGAELYPAESRLVDTANQFHMWVMDSEKMRFPFGFKCRVTKDGTGEIEKDNSKQRPFEKGE